MNGTLRAQLENSSEIKNILKRVSTSFNIEDGRAVNAHLIYLPCTEDNKTNHGELLKCIKGGIIQNFVFSHKEIQKKLGKSGKLAMDDLFNKAIRKLSQHTAKGELGELILFTLLDVYLESPKLLSKISMKTNRKMPVFGADAVHGQFISNNFFIYLGESKLHKSFKSAATDAASSIVSAKSKFYEEFDLLDSHIDFPDLTDELQESIIECLNPYNEDINEKIHSPCFIGFTQPEIVLEDEDLYLDSYIQLSQDYINHFYLKAEENGLELEEITLLILPFGCIDELVNDFVSYMGIEK